MNNTKNDKKDYIRVFISLFLFLALLNSIYLAIGLFQSTYGCGHDNYIPPDFQSGFIVLVLNIPIVFFLVKNFQLMRNSKNKQAWYLKIWVQTILGIIFFFGSMFFSAFSDHLLSGYCF